MKKHLILAALLMSNMAAMAQTTDDPIIMTVAGEDVPRSEFEYSYNKNNTDGVIDKKSVEEYVDLFVNYNVSKGKTKEQARIETHDRMIDIQIPLNVPETMGYTARTALPEAEYNAEKDITFYPGLAKTYVTVQPGEFAIFFPQDGHAPCVSDAPEIKKVIFKVKA